MEESILELIIAEQDGKLTETQRKQLVLWRNESETNEAAYQSTIKLWKESAEVPYQTKERKEEDWQVVQAAIQESSRGRTGWMFRIAAAVALLLAAGLFIYQSYLSPTAGYVAYESGTVSKEINLADGSVITLNTESQLWVSEEFNEENRDVRLDGEAFFAVASDKRLPFIISGNGSITEVVGTAFNLLITDQSAELTVTEGLVSFGSATETILVGIDQSAILATGEAPILVSNNLNRLSWKTGELRFEDTPLSKVCRDIAKHYDISIEVAEDAIDLTFTSQYKDAPLEEVLSELELILALDIRLNNTTYQVNLK